VIPISRASISSLSSAYNEHFDWEASVSKFFHVKEGEESGSDVRGPPFIMQTDRRDSGERRKSNT